MSKLVSVILPVFNVELFVNECIQSILTQTYTNIELIIIDDGSTDKSLEECQKYTKFPNVKVFTKKNEGLGITRNYGLELAKGEYICFVDSDDFLSPDFVEKLVFNIEQEKSDFASCNYYSVVGSKKIPQTYIKKDRVLLDNDIKQDFMFSLIGAKSTQKNEYDFNPSVWHNIYKASIINKFNARFVNERIYGSEDVLFNYVYLKNCKKISLITNCLYYYRQNPKSLSSSYRNTRVNEIVNLYNMMKEYVRNDLYDEYVEYRLERMLILKIRKTIILLSNSKEKCKVKKIRSILNKQEVDNALKIYPISRYSFVQRVSAKLMKNKFAFLMYLYSKFYALFKK